jgi:hypothetical protein
MSEPRPAPSSLDYPTLERIRGAAGRFGGAILRTPVWQWQTGIVETSLAASTEVWLKLELFHSSAARHWLPRRSYRYFANQAM